MNLIKRSKKYRKSLIFLSSLAVMIPFITSFNNNKFKETKAIRDIVYIAIDATNEIGYLAATKFDGIDKLTYHCEVDLTKERENTIFLQDTWQGSSQYLEYIKTIEILDEIIFTNCSYLFKGLPNLETINNIKNLKVLQCHTFEYMFDESPNLRTVDFTGFDVSGCENFRNMFYGSAFESLDLSMFDTSNGGDFREMFKSCKNLTNLNISNFNTKKASNMTSMFASCPNLDYLDISSFDLSNNPLTEAFFRGTKPSVIVAPKLVPAHGFDNVVEFDLQFVSMETPYYYDIDLNTYSDMAESNKSITYYHFRVIDSIKRAAELMTGLFSDVEDLTTLPVDKVIEKWDSLIDGFYRFFPLNEGNEHIYEIFEKCKSSTINEIMGKWLKTYDEVYQTFCHALVDCGGDFLKRLPNALEPDGLIHIGIDSEDNIAYLSSVDTYEILKSASRTKLNLAQNTIENSIFSLLDPTNYIDITQVIIQDEIEILNCKNLFKGLSNVVSIEGIGNINAENNTFCNSMFEDCVKLETVDFEGFNTDKVVSTDSMFKGCSSLVEIKSLSFTSKTLISISEMFSGCENIVLLDLSNFDLTNVNNAFNFLYNSTPFYIKTPLAMPSSSSCDLNLYFPVLITNLKYYDTLFNTYEKLPRSNKSITIISTFGKYILEGTCNDFAKDCAYYCDTNGNTSEEKLIKLWEDQAKNFNEKIKGTSSECLLEFFEQDNSTSTCQALKEFSERYDYIYGKYHDILDEHGGNFANRSVDFIESPLGTNILYKINNLDDSSSLFLIVLVVSITALISLIFAYKKCRNQEN